MPLLRVKWSDRHLRSGFHRVVACPRILRTKALMSVDELSKESGEKGGEVFVGTSERGAGEEGQFLTEET